ncbi:peptidase M48-like protein [Mumia flava]|uniref:Peptidase M48-like protein n=1 Tax=Mumia flava TaxID=1348852 RepID=A0A0B2BLH4_9ACTN|nr:M56 family metallopeptidase [Mumia flava]PJJ56397.1 peptidase M48-like protein [Mumia flava]
MTTPLMLAMIALALAQPVPAALARTRWPDRSPRAAIVLWQSLALAAVLATLGAGLSAAWWLVLHEGRPVADPGLLRVGLHVACLGLTLLVGVRLTWAAWSVGRELRSARRRHRHLVDLLGAPDAAHGGVRVLDASDPIAYCVPGLDSRVVITRGALSALEEPEVEAVLAHERSHLRARHDLVVEGFSALHRAFPRLLRSDASLDRTRELVEMLADDRARVRTGELPLARALVKVGGRPAPQGALGSGGGVLERRLLRIADPPQARAAAAACYLLAAAVTIGPTAALAIPWLSSAAATLRLG